MRKKPQAFLLLVFFLGLVRGICAEDAPQTASMPVLVISGLGGSKAQIRGWQPAMGQGISEMLIESLESSDHKFQILEPAEASDLQKEPGTGGSDSAGSETKPATGGSKKPANGAAGKKPVNGAAAGSGQPDTGDAANSEKQPDTGASADSDFTFCGDVTQFTAQTNNSKIGDFISSSSFANLGGKIITARVEIEWRIVDNETKRVVKRGITACSASGPEFDMPALSSADQQSSGSGSAAAPAKTAASKKGGNAKKSGSNNSALANNFYSGLTKAFGNAPDEGNGGGNDSASDSSGTTAKSSKNSTKKSPAAAPAAGGDVVGDDSATYDYGNPDFVNSALGKAACKAVTNIIEQLDAISLPEPARVSRLKDATDTLKHTPGKVLAVVGNTTIVVSLGSKEGFKAGDQLELYQNNDVKDDKGNVVFTDEKLVGEITLSEVQDEKSLGSYSGATPAQQGWMVKAK